LGNSEIIASIEDPYSVSEDNNLAGTNTPLVQAIMKLEEGMLQSNCLMIDGEPTEDEMDVLLDRVENVCASAHEELESREVEFYGG
jgi:hypothetical protein